MPRSIPRHSMLLMCHYSIAGTKCTFNPEYRNFSTHVRLSADDLNLDLYPLRYAEKHPDSDPSLNALHCLWKCPTELPSQTTSNSSLLDLIFRRNPETRDKIVICWSHASLYLVYTQCVCSLHRCLTVSEFSDSDTQRSACKPI